MGVAPETIRLVAEIAAAQHGVVSGRQMRWAGVAERTLGSWVRAHRVYRTTWSVYAFTPRVDDLGQVYAALLGAGADRHLCGVGPPRGDGADVVRATHLDGGVAVSHWGALRLHSVARVPVLPVDVATVGRPRPRVAGVRGHRFARLHPADLVWVSGVPTTTVIRAIIDVAPRTGSRRLGRLLREAQFLGQLAAPELLAACERMPWHPGVRALERCDPDLRLRSTGDSPLAGDVAVFLEHETALGPWTPQHPVAAGGRAYRPDFARPDLRLVVEADGAGAHGQTRGRTGDARRDAELLADGWATVRVTHHRLAAEGDDLRSTLHRIASARGWEGPAPGWRPRSATRPAGRAA